MDSWEEGFDTWTPRTPRQAERGDETGTDLDRAELLRLARELAERRQTSPTGTDAEVEQLKQSLRERAAAVALRERELAELQQRLERGRPSVRDRLESRTKRSEAVDGEALAARERATHERAQALEERERAIEAQTADVDAGAARLAEREHELARELQAVETKLAETEAERELATAERERLEERDRAVHDREKTLAAVRVEVETEREKLDARARELEAQAAARTSAGQHDEPQARLVVQHDPTPALARGEERERELARRESKLEDTERDLALVRQALDAERNALLERERRFHHREVSEVRESSARPFAPPSFSEGLASLARSRSRH
jgi:hypothetical protein